jgi:hypothetical protein
MQPDADVLCMFHDVIACLAQAEEMGHRDLMADSPG